MPSSAYIALSGLTARSAHLDSLASDIANAGTAGYKGLKHSSVTAERDFAAALDAAIDVKPGPEHTDFTDGNIVTTGRDLDLAVEGDGFFVVETANGPRYTRNGHFIRKMDGTLVTQDGLPLLSRDGRHITLEAGVVRIEADGTVFSGKEPVGKLAVVRFAPDTRLTREGAARFNAPADAVIEANDTAVHSGVLEQSNVSVFERLAEMTHTSRSFESLYRAIQTVMNDIDGRTISELGKK